MRELSVNKRGNYVVEWKDGSEADHFPAIWFEDGFSQKRVAHGHGGRTAMVSCDVSTRFWDDETLFSRIDYRPYSKDKWFKENYWNGYYDIFTRPIHRKKKIKLMAKGFTFAEPDSSEIEIDFDYGGYFAELEKIEESAAGRALAFDEGYLKLVIHFRRERSARLRKLKIESAKSLVCEACGFDFQKAYRGKIGQEFAEVHHLRQLSGGTRESLLRHLAVLCSNCHRMIHSAMRQQKEMSKLSIKEFRKRFVRWNACYDHQDD